jgi:hypothetical protein
MSTTNPNDQLAEQISKELVEKGLIPQASLKKITQSIGQGTIKDSEWKVFLEEIINKPKTLPNETK